MPIFKLQTNLAANAIPTDFKFDVARLLAKIFAKPVDWMLINVLANQDMSFGLDDKPACLIEVESIGVIDKEINKSHSKHIMQFITEKLNIPHEKIYITFTDLAKQNVGYMSTTYDDDNLKNLIAKYVEKSN